MDIVKLGYLAGIIDGEGSVTLNRLRQQNGKWKISARIDITNSDCQLLSFCASILEELTGKQVKFILTDQRANRQVFRIQIQRRTSVVAVLDAIEPYLISKKEQARIIRQFLKIKSPYSVWTEAQAVLHANILNLNKIGNTHLARNDYQGASLCRDGGIVWSAMNI